MKKKVVSSALIISTAIGILLYISSCKTVDVFERNVPIPAQEWQNSYKPSLDFVITDTISSYNIYVTLRHTHAYNYNNIWLNINYQLPGDTLNKQRVNLTLANAKGWLGIGMDDIYEIRQLITPQPFRFKKSGQAIFTLEQVMRENPLKHIMNAGIRVEKVQH